MFLRLAAYRFGNEQLFGARLIGPGRVCAPESGTTRALTELAALMGDRNVQAAREAGIRAVVAHRRGALAEE
ncbi:50S ribosomal protein L18 [Streptomyces laurentii]|uniref:50S ribosomal protein L18 n=1 Tax=Streptomyces laurentii TaxID=39478 RepID=A0A160P9M4_STRLU|nr:50S ribosomal protein L18 [Streptomyces laurentii]